MSRLGMSQTIEKNPFPALDTFHVATNARLWEIHIRKLFIFDWKIAGNSFKTMDGLSISIYNDLQ